MWIYQNYIVLLVSEQLLMKILGIESSCDETAAGIVNDGGMVLSNVISTQIDIHARYGGIVPEVASRQHVLDIRPVCEQAIKEAGIQWPDVDVVAVTHGPGLAGSLIVGLNFAKGLSASLGHAVEGHVVIYRARQDPPYGSVWSIGFREINTGDEASACASRGRR